MRAEAGVGPARRGRSSRGRRGSLALVRRGWKVAAAVIVLVVLAAIALGFAYAGSADRIAGGVEVSGVDVGGLTAQQAEQRLTARAQTLSSEQVVFTGAGRRWSS